MEEPDPCRTQPESHLDTISTTTSTPSPEVERGRGRGRLPIMSGSFFSYLRLPVLASSAVAVVGSSLLYFKQKYAPAPTWTLPVAPD